MSYMFYQCENLFAVNGFTNKTEYVTDMNKMFLECYQLCDLGDISNLNTTEVNDMSLMFINCESLKKIPDLSSWKTNKVINMSGMIENCGITH